MMNRPSQWSNHPTQLSTVLGQVVVLYSDSGVLGLAGQRQTYCFFTRSQVWEEGTCVIRVGEEVMMDARLAPEQQRNEMVPYLATAVWREGSNIPPALSLRLLSPHTQQELNHYQLAVAGLVGLLPDIMEDRVGPTQVMQGIVASQGIREKEGVKVNKAVTSNAEVLTGEGEPRKRKKRQKSSTDEEEPVKHLDCLHKINDMIAELEKKVATDPPKVTQHPKASPQPEVIAYPQPGVAYSLNRPPSSPTSIGFPNPKRITAPAWLGLTVAPGSIPTSVNPSNNQLVPLKDASYSIKDESDVEDKSPIKKSLFSNIFEHEERATSPENENPVLARLDVRPDTRGKAKLSNLLQDRILTKTKERESVHEGGRMVNVDNSREKTTSQSRSRSRDKTWKKRHKSRGGSQRERRSRSKSRLRRSRKRSRSRSKSCHSDKVGQKNKKSRSNSSDSKGQRSKKDRSNTFDKERSKRKRNKSKSRSRSKRKYKKKSKSRSRSKSNTCKDKSSRESKGDKKLLMKSISPSRRKEMGKASKNLRSTSPSPQRNKYKEKKRKRSQSRQKDKYKSNKKKSKRKSRSVSPSENKNGDLRTFIEKQKRNDVEKEFCPFDNKKSDCESEASDDELIIKKRRLNRLKFLSKFKEVQKEEEVCDTNVVISSTKNDDGSIPIKFFEQPVNTFEDDDNNIQPVVFFDAEIMNVGSCTHILQVGASATSWDKSSTFFKYMQPDLLHGSHLEKLIADSKFEVMDSLRLKTSKFDVAHSGKLNLYFKHPELGNIKAEQEKDVLTAFINFLQSVKGGKSVILVTHRKDTVLPALFSLLSKHELLTKFSALVSHCCELVHLAWELHMDHLWQGARYPGLRTVAEFVVKDLQWDDGYTPCDRTSYLLEKLVNKLREEHEINKGDRFVEQCGGVGVMDYMTAKYNLVQDASGDYSKGGIGTPEYVEVVRGSDQWGRKIRIDLRWKKEPGQIEERSNRRTPLPEPDSLLNDGEHHVRILKPSESKNVSCKSLLTSTSWSDKSFNTYLPPGVSKVSPLSTTSLLLRVPALKPRISELLGASVLIQQNPEFTSCKILRSTEVLTQPKNSMFPMVEAMLENISKEEVILDSKVINFAVANIKIDSKFEI